MAKAARALAPSTLKPYLAPVLLRATGKERNSRTIVAKRAEVRPTCSNAAAAEHDYTIDYFLRSIGPRSHQ